MEEKEDLIDLGKLGKKVWAKKMLMLKALGIAIVLSSLIILCVPRTYSSGSKLAPEIVSSGGISSTIGSLAESFGIEMSQIETSDAISPLLYPDLMEDNGFVASLLTIRVKSCDGEINCTYYEYLDKYQEMPWWGYVTKWIKGLLPKPSKKTVSTGAGTKKSPYILSEHEHVIAMQARNNITLTVDKQTGVLSITTVAQDPLICKTLADSTTVKLQHFITDYRTNKARVDLEYYKKLEAEAKARYDKAHRDYSQFSDANTDMVLQTHRAKLEDLENEMQIAYSAYSSINVQLQGAMAKVQEKTPAFTILKGAEVPVKPSGPKRMLFVLGMTMLTGLAMTIYILKDDIKESLKGK